jgi:hypothetical protein
MAIEIVKNRFWKLEHAAAKRHPQVTRAYFSAPYVRLRPARLTRPPDLWIILEIRRVLDID